ncbi:MAG: helix-turn-helix domain-containing protein [Candidatus Eremiobacteraeota bacterium]|nr:helix-turn-helix domain-containing protein [Candidatus Eremiobacteraeota bacterium]
MLRARINERLARAARFPVTLVVAPAGFGKSVALRDFVETARLDAVRYDVAREDRTLLGFVHGLSAALAPVVPTALAAFPAMQQRLMAAADPVLELTDWFAEHLKRTVCTVVVDDLHHAGADPNAVALLVALIERTAERIRWIVATRSDAGLPIASWIGYGRMDYPVGEDDLRFTADEALAAADDAQASAEPNEIEALRELTGGWPIALAIALRTRTHAADLRAAASGTREMVYRYLAEQVFTGLSRAQQRFLLRTAVFATFDSALAEALGADAPFLADLRRSVTFLSATESNALRYHDLFRDFLERELRRAGASAWYDAHAEAGALLEARGDVAAALALYAKVAAIDPIVRLAERDGIELLERGESEVLAQALDVLPDDVRRGHAALLGVRATLDANRGRFDVAEPGFIAAIARAEDPLRLALVHRYALELVRQERDCTALLEPYAHDEDVPPAQRVAILGTLATGYAHAGRVGDALAAARRALDRADALGDDARARLYQQAAYVHQFAPAPAHERARDYATLAVELATARGLYEVAARAFSVLYTVVNDEDDDPIATLAILDRLDECARKGASRQARVFGVVAAYAIEVERGDDAALERLDRALDDERAAPAAARAQALLPAYALRAAWERDFVRAHTLLAGTALAQATEERRALRAAEIALYAFAAGAHDDGDAALRAALDALSRCARTTPRTVRVLLTAALAELVRGHATSAHRHLAEAERRTTPAMRRLRALAHAVRAAARVQLEQADPAALAAALERLRAEHVGGLARLIAALPFAATGEAAGNYARLTPAEREILQLLAKGASTKDVAARTGRSPQTVDTHIRSICRKLSCSGRREAVAIATGAGWVVA